MKLNRDVFGAWVEDGVLRECERALVVTKNDGWCPDVDAEILYETGEPGEAKAYFLPNTSARGASVWLELLPLEHPRHTRPRTICIRQSLYRNRVLDK